MEKETTNQTNAGRQEESMLNEHERRIQKAIELMLSYAENKLNAQSEMPEFQEGEKKEAADHYKKECRLALNEIGWVFERVELARKYFDDFTKMQAKVYELENK
jgi:hypothetical protein